MFYSFSWDRDWPALKDQVARSFADWIAVDTRVKEEVSPASRG